MGLIIIHVDMDAFFAAVEIRDNPDLAGKPLIIGALPSERGVVSTCSYEARKYGVRSAMSIKEAYRLCPHGIFMHPSANKYGAVSRQIREIWSSYTDLVECCSIDEGFLDVTGSAHLFGDARQVGRDIKDKIKNITKLTCSVGIGYSFMSAKLASEEKKPDGFFEIPDPEFLKELIIDRDVRIIYGVGNKTAGNLRKAGINTVRDIYNNKQAVISLLGDYGRQIIDLAEGIDNRRVATYSEPKSIGKEHTFQQDTTDIEYLKDVLLLIAKELSFDIRLKGIYCRTVTLKVTYGNMQKITRSKSEDYTNRAEDIYKIASAMLDKIEKRPMRLVGISLSGLAKSYIKQMSLLDNTNGQKEMADTAVFNLQRKYGLNIIKKGNELNAEKHLGID